MSRCKWGDIHIDGRAGVHGGGLASYEAGTKMVDGYRVVPWKGACAFLRNPACVSNIVQVTLVHRVTGQLLRQPLSEEAKDDSYFGDRWKHETGSVF